MARLLKVAAAQVGRIDRKTSRQAVLIRLIALLEQAAAEGVQLAVFPETTFCGFFPRYIIRDEAELDSYFELETAEDGITSSTNVKPFFDRARELGIDVTIGYGERTPEGERYNSASYVSGQNGKVLGKTRKVHLAGTVEPFDDEPETTNQLEKRYFTPGNLGFEAFRATSLKKAAGGACSPVVGQLICMDRRWPEAWRCLGLSGVEIVCSGFVTTAYAPRLWAGDQNISRKDACELVTSQHKLVVQANAYTNSTFCIAAARAGIDDGVHPLISGSIIVDPQGRIVAENATEKDELVVAEIDLDACRQGKERTFNFDKHRRPEAYGRLLAQKGVIEPKEPAEQ